MPIINTEELVQGAHNPEGRQIYNGLDCCLTLEILEEVSLLFNRPPDVYSYELGLQAPILDVMLRGFKVNQNERNRALVRLRAQRDRLYSHLNKMAYAIWGQPLNPRSHPQLREFFYVRMGIPEQWITDKGERKLSFRRDVLEKLELYFYAMPIVATILAIRDTAKKIETLETEIDSDGRMRTSYNIGGTETWRLSSSSNAFGTGGNVQNWAEALRIIFEADEGWKLCVIDFEQVESREIGWKIGQQFDDWRYLDACESGDLHTTVTKMTAPELPWTGDMRRDKEIADGTLLYREHSHRHLNKVLGHGTNLLGQPWTMSRHTHIPVEVIQRFQDNYFAQFPGIPRWHRWTAQELQTNMKIELPFGAVRHFFGRPEDDATLREAVACQGQAPAAFRTNISLYRIWKSLPQVQCLAQTHDSITFQFREKEEAEVIPAALGLMAVWQEHNGRRFVVPGEAKVGWNWSRHHDPGKPTGPKNQLNPNGLLKWKGPGADKRTRLSLMETPQ